MLKFLDNRQHEKPHKSPKKYEPNFLYGNSFQSPKQFQTKYTLFQNSSYVNPYLEYEPTRLVKIPSESLCHIQPQWKRKVDLQSVEEQKIISSHPDLNDIEKSKYITSFCNEYNRNKSRFKKNKGQFTTFIEKNLKFKSLGPLHGDYRDESRIKQTRRTVWLKSSKSTFESDGKSFKKNLDLNNSIKSSISKNSQLLTQKHRIRLNRERVYNEYKNSLEKRKHDINNSILFQLPKTGPEHELTFYDISKKSFYGSRYQIFQNKLNQSQQLTKDLEKFQIITRNRFNK